MQPDSTNAVRHRPELSRFELSTAAGLAVVDYRRSGETLVLYHTEVPYAERGQGIGQRLVYGALRGVRSMGVKVVPSCWFVREFIDQNEEFSELVAS